MEASANTAKRGLPAKRTGKMGRLSRGFSEPVRGTLNELGDMAAFSLRALAEMRGAWRYSGEILRQASILIVGSALVVWFLDICLGGICGQQSGYILGTYGASAYSGIYTSYCNVRGSLIGFMFGYALACKVGTGLAAEIGAMRINNELEAMESLGIDPMRYVVASRLIAGIIVFPFIAAAGVALMFLSDYLNNVHVTYVQSQGQWQQVHFQFIRPIDLVWNFVWVMTEGVVIMLVGMYFGYRASGGPVGVGTATARSMAFNIVFVHILGGFLVLALFGLYPKVPIGG